MKIRPTGCPPAERLARLAMMIVACLSLAACAGTGDPGGDPRPEKTKASSAAGSSTEEAATLTVTAGTPPSPTPYVSPTPPPTQVPPAWESIARGISRVYLPVPTPGSSEPSYFYVLKIDPARASFKVIYDDEEPHTVEEWQSITQAPIIFNSGFFTGSNTPNGRIITDGTMHGETLDYGNDAVGVRGLFAVSGRRPEIYALGRSDYNPRGLRFDQAVESYPLLLLPGGQPTFPKETHLRARRTVIGMDQDNNVIVIISDISLYSLYELAQWLATSNLGLDSALNLDGGRSTGIMVLLPGEEKLINSYVPVPIVIAIYPQP